MLDLFSLIIISICLIALLAGSYTDLKTREVPDWLNYALIGIGLSIRSLNSLILWDYKPILYGVIGLGIFVGIALIMFYTGQWGGGDAKMLMGLGALLGFDLTFSSLSISFIIALIFIGAVYGMGWMLVLVIRHWKPFAKQFHEIMHKRSVLYVRTAVLSVSTILLISIFFLKDATIRFLIVVLILLSYTLLYLYFLIKSVELVCMIKRIPTEKLTEGDWIAEEIKKGKKVIAGPKDLGISREQIAELKKLKIKEVIVKEGVPFIPSFLLAFIFSLALGNPITLLVYLFP